MKEVIVRSKPKTLSVSLDLVTIEEMNILLKEHEGYVDGDRRTLELYVLKK